MGKTSWTDQGAVVVFFFEGKSLRGFGPRLAMSDESVRKRVSRLMDKLKLGLSRVCG